MGESIFLPYYKIQPWISGVLTDNQNQPQNTFLQNYFGVNRGDTSEYDTVNFDRDFGIRNVIGQFVDPKGVQTEIQDRTYDGLYFAFSYFKEPWSSPEFEDLQWRAAGSQLGDVKGYQEQYRLAMNKKVFWAYMARTNLFEWAASQIIFTGGYTSKSDKHKDVTYNFQRPILTNNLSYTDIDGRIYTFADANERENFLNSNRVSQVDLTTLVANGGAGKRAWNSTGGTKGVSPYTDLTLMVQGATKGSGIDAFLMSSDVYSLYLADPLWAKAADKTLNLATTLQAQVLPTLKNIADLQLVNYHVVPGRAPVPIYIYNAEYVDRITGISTRFVPNGYVVALPSANHGSTIFGRIKHKRAQYQAMPIWINYWEDTKDGGEQWEMHSNFVMGHKKIQDIICWKVI